MEFAINTVVTLTACTAFGPNAFAAASNCMSPQNPVKRSAPPSFHALKQELQQTLGTVILVLFCILVAFTRMSSPSPWKCLCILDFCTLLYFSYNYPDHFSPADLFHNLMSLFYENSISSTIFIFYLLISENQIRLQPVWGK